jgi:hypothetical protein
MIRINLLGRERPKKTSTSWWRELFKTNAPRTRPAPVPQPASVHPLTTPSDRRPSLRMLADVAESHDADDRLGFKAFADAIAGIIDSPRTATPLVMAINAKWGAGKTTLGQMIRRRLEAKPAADSYSPHVTCWFNAWMHDDAPNLASSLAADIAQEANLSRGWLRRIVRPLPSSLSTAKQRRIRKGLISFAILALIILACTAGSLRLGFSLSDVVKLSPEVIKSLTGLQGGAYATALVVTFLLLFKAALSILPVAKSVGEFVKDPKSAAATASMQEVRSQLGKLIKQATPRKCKFVIFVDDLDRCRPPRSVDVLEAINQLLDHPSVVVVLMADMQVVAKCANIKYTSLAGPADISRTTRPPTGFSAYGWNYIQKIIQLQFDLPIHPVGEIRRMLETLVKLVKEDPEERARGRLAAIWQRIRLNIDRVMGRLRIPSGHPYPLGWAILLVLLMGFSWSDWATRLYLSTGSTFFIVARRINTLLVVLVVVASGVLIVVIQTAERRRRREIDQQIRSEIAAGERDFSRVEASIKKSNSSWRNDPLVEGLLRERLQRYLEDESELQREAEDEVMRHLEPLPRHAKRLLNRLRLLLFVAHERKMFGGKPPLSPRQIGKWAVLCERWPELAQAICTDPGIMVRLEDPKKHRAVVRQRAPLYQDDPALREFCLSADGVKLSLVMVRIVEFASANAPSVPRDQQSSVAHP